MARLALLAAVVALAPAASAASVSSGLEIAGTVAVDPQPGNPAFGFGSVWVPSSARGMLDRVDPATLTVIARIASSTATTPVPNEYFDSVAVSPDAVWHASDVGNVVVRIDPGTNAVVARIPVGGRPGAIAATKSGVYVSLFETSSVLRIDPSTNTVVKRVNIGGPAEGVAVAGGSVWAVTSAGPAVVRLDPATLAVRKRISIAAKARYSGGYFSAWWISAQGSTVCAGNQLQNVITRVSARSGRVVKQTTLPFGKVPFSTAAAAGACWAVNGGGVFELPAAGPTRAAHLPGLKGSAFVGVAVGAGAGWVTSAGRNELLKVTSAP